MLGGINRTVLSSRTTEGHSQTGKSPFQIAFHGSINQGINMRKENCNLSILFQETDDRFIQSRQSLILFVLPGVVYRPAIEYVVREDNTVLFIPPSIWQNIYTASTAYGCVWCTGSGILKPFTSDTMAEWMKEAMIFAAGLGTRLRPLTDNLPKALVPVGGKPMLEHVILRLKAAGFAHIVINVHHFGQKIIDFLEEHKNFGVAVDISDERDALLDTGGGIRQGFRFSQIHPERPRRSRTSLDYRLTSH